MKCPYADVAAAGPTSSGDGDGTTIHRSDPTGPRPPGAAEPAVHRSGPDADRRPRRTTLDRTVGLTPARRAVLTGWTSARALVDIGRPATGLRQADRTATRLDRLERDGVTDPDWVRGMRMRLLLTMADARVELGEIDEAERLLAAADQLTAAVGGVAAAHLAASRAVLLARTGRTAPAWVELDAAIAATRRPGAALVRMLHWRALLHLGDGRPDEAQADCARAHRLAEDLGLIAGVALAVHQRGLVHFVGGDLPRALADMNRAEEIDPTVRVGYRALDRARVLAAAGLVFEAGEAAARAEEAFAAERSRVDLAEALLVLADLDLLRGDPDSALRRARQATRSYAAARHPRGELSARLTAVRAEARLVGAAGSGHRETTPAGADRPGDRRRRADRVAAHAGRLASDLVAAGLDEDHRTVRLLQADALLLADRPDAAEAAIEAAGVLGGGRLRGTNQVAGIAIDLHVRVVRARLQFARGRVVAGLAEIRRGLDDLARYQARFGSQDLQSAAALHGRELTALGLRAALETEAPAVVLQWLERSRGAGTRLPAVRPSPDPALGRELGQLRTAMFLAHLAASRGVPDPALDRRVDGLRRRVRARSWSVAGTGTVDRPLSLAAVRRRLAQTDPRISIVAPFRGRGRFHALVITADAARYLPTEPGFPLDRLLARVVGDLDILADHRVPEPLRDVARSSLRAGLASVARVIVDPLLPFVDDGPVIVAATGAAAVVPWALLPGLTGRPVSVVASVTGALAALDRPADDRRRGVLAVAGPDLPHGRAEVEAVAAAHPGAVLLTGDEATGAQVLRAIPDRGLLHIAAHGHHEPASPLFSGVLLGDGLLYGYDVSPNPAIPAQVVLSSCDVGRADDRPGGEPLGLVAALLRSGVSTVVAGTARISDRAAAATMTAYHRRLAAGDRPAQALADAVAQVATTTDDPTPFTCFGAGM